MCMFSRSADVSNTEIFARRDDKGVQHLVYRMRFKASEALAMILPVPTPPDAQEDTLSLVDMRGYTKFFDDLARGFEAPKPPKQKGGFGGGGFGGDSKPKLKVLSVGGYEASFVPSLSDFERLDERFQLPRKIWKQLPQYEHYGFAVFKLKAGASQAPPLGFRFPTTLRREVFFPTIHVHDGELTDRADFDHTLYAQLSADQAMYADDWKESAELARSFIHRERSRRMVDADAHVYRRVLRGTLPNKDTLV